MKLLLKHITIIVCALSMLWGSSCNKEEKHEQEQTQTIIFYFAGTSLTFYYYKNISALKDALRGDIKGDSRVMLFFQQSEKNSGEIIELTYENGLCEEKKLATHQLPERMDADGLSHILKDIMRLAPADSYSLIIGSHGTGWVPIDGQMDGAVQSATLDAHTAPATYWQRTGEEMTRYLGEDTNPQNAFDIPTLSQAITKTGVKMEYILFDACFMANVESAYELRNNTKYIVGSVCEIMGSGFPYTTVLPCMLTNRGTGYDLDGVCRAFNTFYDDNYGYSGSISLIDCSQLDALAAEMKRVNLGAQREYNIDDLQFYEGQVRHIFFDLGDYIDKACTDAAAVSSFKAQMEKAVPAKFTLDSFWSTYVTSNHYPVTSFSGLSTSAPSILFRESYPQTAWYKATH